MARPRTANKHLPKYVSLQHVASAKLRGLDLTLGDRMDKAGTATRADFDAAMSAASQPTAYCRYCGVPDGDGHTAACVALVGRR